MPYVEGHGTTEVISVRRAETAVYIFNRYNPLPLARENCILTFATANNLAGWLGSLVVWVLTRLSATALFVSKLGKLFTPTCLCHQARR